MKIAHLIPQFYPHIGGAEICIHNVCRTLAKNGHDAIVITSTLPPEESPKLPYKIEYLWSKTGGLFRNLPYFLGKAYLHYALAKLQQKHKFDLWQLTNGWPLAVFAVDFFKKNKIPCILRCCGDDIQKFPEIGYGMRLDMRIDALVTEKYPLFDGFVALTPSVREEYLQLGIPDNKIRIIPNGVDTAKFAKLSDEKVCEIRESLGIKVLQKPLILTVGRYHPKKGFDLIPEIAEKLRSKGLEFNWLIVGRNVCEIRKKHPDCEKLGIIFIEKFAKFAGKDAFNLPSQELIDLYCSADIFALPTLVETFGMVLVEAMAAGLPIVTTDAPGVRDVIEEEREGFKVTAGDAEAFAEKLADLILNIELRMKISRNCLKSSQNYDWKNVSRRYLDFYDEIGKTFE
jgi:glycosyltransferase involved in cell wall biosynthesis